MTTSGSLLNLIQFDTSLEADAFRLLAKVDLDGCSKTLGQLITRLDVSGASTRPEEVRLLLLDVLQKINRRLHRTQTDEAAYQENRLALLALFGSLVSAAEARDAFLPALRTLLSPLLAINSSVHPLVRRARAFVSENYNQRMSLSTISSFLNVSPNYLSRLFRKETGRTLTASIQEIRLEHALVLLAEGRRSISEIAYLVGYQNYRDFYRNFVKYEDSSPREFRQRFCGDGSGGSKPTAPTV